jgi:hypothetical protein
MNQTAARKIVLLTDYRGHRSSTAERNSNEKCFSKKESMQQVPTQDGIGPGPAGVSTGHSDACLPRKTDLSGRLRQKTERRKGTRSGLDSRKETVAGVL